MFQKLFTFIIQMTPGTKRGFWKWWYNVFAARANNSDFKFMNYGYYEDSFFPNISPDDENERYPIHLYHHVATQVDISGKTVLEVGAGRGGGASYVTRYLNPACVRGIDISKTAIELCNEIHKVPNLFFTEGDSENIQFEDEEFDIILNVESSHCYGNMEKFLNEVKRVLKPDGYFLWCDLRAGKDRELISNQFQNSGLEIVQEKDITKNIIIALDKMSKKRKSAIQEKVPFPIRKIFESYAGVKGSKIHNSFINGNLLYLSAALKKLY